MNTTFVPKHLTDAQLQECLEELVLRRYNMANLLADDVAVHGIGFVYKAKGRVGGGLETSWSVALDATYVCDTDATADTLGDAFEEAARRIGWKAKHSTKLIGKDPDPVPTGSEELEDA